MQGQGQATCCLRPTSTLVCQALNTAAAWRVAEGVFRGSSLCTPKKGVPEFPHNPANFQCPCEPTKAFIYIHNTLLRIFSLLYTCIYCICCQFERGSQVSWLTRYHTRIRVFPAISAFPATLRNPNLPSALPSPNTSNVAATALRYILQRTARK